MRCRKKSIIRWEKIVEFYGKIRIIKANLWRTMKFIIETGNKNAILRKRSDAIRSSEISQFRSLAQEMIAYIRQPENRAAWLAAPQIGLNKRLIAVSLLKDYSDETYRSLAMINPEILEHSEDQNIDDEWCLSVPWWQWIVSRFTTIKVRYFDTSGKTNTLRLTWLAARIVQHEIDHLDGILFTDKIISSKVLEYDNRKETLVSSKM